MWTVGRQVDRCEETNSIYLTGPEKDEIWGFVHSSLVVMSMLSIIAFFAPQEGTIVLAGVILMITQTLWHLRDSEERKMIKGVDDAVDKMADMPGCATSRLAHKEVPKTDAKAKKQC